MKEFCAELNAADGDPEAEQLVRDKHFRIEIAKYVSDEIKRSSDSKVLCLMDSMDHIAPASDVPRYLQLIEEACPDVKPTHSTLPRFFAEARSSVKNPPVRRGELREPSRNISNYLWLIPNCTSSRVRVKMANDRTQTLLERCADPLLALANMHGAEIPNAHLQIAWKYLLTNHAHDSICGCSIDQVHRDMMYRFEQAQVLGEQICHQSFGALTQTSVELAQKKDEFTITILNPLPESREEAVIFDVDLPLDYPAEFADSFFSPPVKSFIIEDADGNTIPYQRLRIIPKTNERSRFARFCFQSDGAFTRYTVAAHLALPGLGFRSLRIKPAAHPVRAVGSLRTGPASAENEYIAVAIAGDGTLNLTDKSTGESYRDLLTYSSRSELGDGWFHVHSVNDEQLLSTGATVQTAVVSDGPEVVTFRVTATLQVPRRMDQASLAPSPELVPLQITNLVTLRQGARTLDVEVQVDNTPEDHRLQLLLPTDCPEATIWLAHQPFDFVERSVALDPRTASWQEIEQAEKPFLGIASIGHGKRGLALISAAGVHEGGVSDDQRRTLFATLLRSFRQTIATGGEPDGLEKGQHSFKFALLPFSGELPRAGALRELARLQTRLLTRQSGKRPSGYPPLQGTGSATQSFVELLDGNLAVSAIKTPEKGEGLILRLWNPTSQPMTESIRFWKNIQSVECVNLAEEPLDDAVCTPSSEGREVSITAGAHSIVTLHMTFAGQD